MDRPRYNEGFDGGGRVRAAYRAFEARTGRDLLGPDLTTSAPAGIGNRYPIVPVPLVLADQEYAALARAMRQRGLALQRLFLDLVRGETAMRRSIDIPEDVVDEILRSAGGPPEAWAQAWRDHDLEAVRFTYAPDLVRAADGQWLVLEDNVGCVGGVVDADTVVERVCESLDVSLHPSVPHGSSFERAVAAFLTRLGVAPTDTTAAAVLPAASADHESEEHRKAKALLGLGLRLLSPARAETEAVPPLAAVVNLESAAGPGSTGPMSTLFERGCALMTAPGVGILGHKAWLPFVDRIVAWYSAEAPLLRTAATERFRELPADSTDWVLKRGDGCQGQAVIFLDQLSEAERQGLDRRARGWGQAAGAVLQRRVQASVLPVRGSGQNPGDAWQVELRPLVYVVGAGTALVADCPSARAFVNRDGRGVGNMSRGAHYLAVVREPVGPATA